MIAEQSVTPLQRLRWWEGEGGNQGNVGRGFIWELGRGGGWQRRETAKLEGTRRKGGTARARDTAGWLAGSGVQVGVGLDRGQETNETNETKPDTDRQGGMPRRVDPDPTRIQAILLFIE